MNKNNEIVPQLGESYGEKAHTYKLNRELSHILKLKDREASLGNTTDNSIDERFLEAQMIIKSMHQMLVQEEAVRDKENRKYVLKRMEQGCFECKKNGTEKKSGSEFNIESAPYPNYGSSTWIVCKTCNYKEMV